jgi:cell division protein FtsB
LTLLLFAIRFWNCKRNVAYREQSTAEQNRILSELKRLNTEIESLKTRLNELQQGSQAYTQLAKEILEKQANRQVGL